MKDRLQELHLLVGDGTLRREKTDTWCGERTRRASVASAGTSQWYDGEVSQSISVLTPKRAPETALLLFAKLKVQSSILLKKQRRRDDSFVLDLKNRVKNILRDVSEIRRITMELKVLHTTALMSPIASEDAGPKMKEVEGEARSASMRICLQLKELERSAVPSAGAVTRMRDAQLSYARKAYINAMESLERELTYYANKLREQVRQQMKIARNQVCDSREVDSYIDEGKLHLFVDNYQAMEQETRTALISERHDELTRIEASIVEIRNLFIHMANLVAEQGDVVDSIESHVLAAAEDATAGRRQLKNAKRKQSSARKKKLWLAGIGAGVTTAVLVTVVLL